MLCNYFITPSYLVTTILWYVVDILLSYIIFQYEDILLVNVYLPCKATVQREEKFADCLASVMNDIVDITF